MKPSYEVYKVRDSEAKGYIILAVDDPHSYQDILDMPDPINVSFGIRIFNYTATTLYFTAQGSGSENAGAKWTWGAVQQLGSIGSGANSYFTLSNLGSRVKPASAVDDSITITVRAYSDAGYTTEVGSGYPILITYHWIKSDTLTLLDLDNFDGGTLENWAVAASEGGNDAGYPTLAIDTSYVLSSPNSALMYHRKYLAPHTTVTFQGYIYKTFNIPACTKAYFLGNIKIRGGNANAGPSSTRTSDVEILQMCYGAGDTILSELRNRVFYLQQTGVPPVWWYHTTNWVRWLGVLPVNQAIEVRLRIRHTLSTTVSNGYQAGESRSYNWFDDLKVVYEP